MARIPGSALIAGALWGIPSTVGLGLGVVLTNQINRARQTAMVPRPGYTVDLDVRPPWVTGAPITIAFLGDSLVEGVGAPRPGQALPAQTAFRLAAHLGRPVRMRGLGIASSRAADVLERQVPLLDADVDLVVVLVGANDATAGTPPWDFGRTIEVLARTAHQITRGAPVVFTGLPDLQDAPLLARPLRDLAGAVGDTLHGVQRRLAIRLAEARYVDLRRAVGGDLRGPLGRVRKDLFAEDHYHPNPAGYAVIAEALARLLTTLILEEEDAAADESEIMDLPTLRAQAMAELADELAGPADDDGLTGLVA